MCLSLSSVAGEMEKNLERVAYTVKSYDPGGKRGPIEPFKIDF